LRVIAHELVMSIKNSVTVDWMHREAGFGEAPAAQIRLSAQLGATAVQNVLQQAEALGMGSVI
jgi:type I restriction enzyme R subunit